jgi:TRAP-type C4-dicarboxylate transport system substrate-binding protein
MEYPYGIVEEKGDHNTMKNKVVVFVVALILVVGLVIAGCAAPAPAPTPTPTPAPTPAPVKPIELRLSFEWAESGIAYQNGWKPWIAEVEKRTGGKVKITPYFSSSLNPLPEAYSACKSGTADIVELNYTVVPGMLNMHELLCEILPSTPWSKWSRIHWEIYEKFKPQYDAEIPGVKPLFTQSFGPATIGMLKKPIRSLADVKGTKIMAIGRASVDQLNALGFTVVEKYPPEFYTTLEKGVTDGAGLCREALYYEFGIAPLLKYIVDVHQANVNFFAVMNMDKWNSLPPDVQKVFEDLGGLYAADLFDQAYYQATRIDGPKETKEKYGTEIITLPPEELAKWDALARPVHEKYLAEMEAKGLPARALYDEYYKLVDQYKW